MIEIYKLNERKVLFSTNNILELSSVINLLTIKRDETVYSYGGRRSTQTVSYKYYDMYELGKMIVNMGYLDLILYMFYISKAQYKLMFEYSKCFRINIDNRWVEILSNPKYSDINGVTQYAYLYQLLGFNFGICKMPTGKGKTELQIAIVESYINSLDGNVAIITPTNIIKENFIERIKQWGVKYNNGEDFNISHNRLDLNNRINIINPTGLLGSNLYKNKDKELFNWLSNVRCAVIDECHHTSSSTWNRFALNHLDKCKYLYAFSATPDTEVNLTPYYTDSVRNWSLNLMEMVGVTGIVRAEMKGEVIEKSIQISKICGKWSSVKDDLHKINKMDNRSLSASLTAKVLNYNYSLDTTLLNPDFVRSLYQYLMRHQNRTFYMLIHKIETGQYIRNELLQYFDDYLSVIMIDASGIMPNDFKDITDLKTYLNNDVNRRTKLILSSTAGSEGMDISNINGVISAVGKNARLTLQTVGRSRATDTLIVLVDDYNNPILLKHNNIKLKHIKKEYGRIEYVQ